MSDYQLPLPARPHNSSHPVSGTALLRSSSLLLYEQARQFSVFVLSSLDAVNTSGGNGDFIDLGVAIAGQLAVCFWSGEVGTGQYDRFPWRGEIALQWQDQLSVRACRGDWGVTFTGYYTPAVTGL